MKMRRQSMIFQLMAIFSALLRHKNYSLMKGSRFESYLILRASSLFITLGSRAFWILSGFCCAKWACSNDVYQSGKRSRHTVFSLSSFSGIHL